MFCILFDDIEKINLLSEIFICSSCSPKSLIAETIQISSAAISSGTKTLTTEAAETSITPTSDTMQTVAEKSGNATQMTKLSHYYTAILEATVSVLLYRVYIYNGVGSNPVEGRTKI